MNSLKLGLDSPLAPLMLGALGRHTPLVADVTGTKHLSSSPPIPTMREICPKSGRKLRVARDLAHSRQLPDPVLVAHVAATTSLTESEAGRVIEDVIAFHAQGVEDYVRRRHAQLKTYGAKNPEIFARIAEELEARVFAAPELSERQLRRMVYG